MIPDSDPLLTAAMDAAFVVGGRIAECSARRNKLLTEDELSEVEGYIAAHFYQTSDPAYTSRSTANKSGAFLDTPSAGNQTRYIERALLLDTSGCLRMLLLRTTASAKWLGKRNDEQYDSIQRQVEY